VNCGKKFIGYPGFMGPGFKEGTQCQNPRCKNMSGDRHPGSPEERGIYVEWINYEEWRKEQ